MAPLRGRLAHRPACNLRPVRMIVIPAGEERPCGVMQRWPRVYVDELLGWIPADADLAVLAPQVVAELWQLDAADPEVDRAASAVRRRERLAALHAVRGHELDRLALVLLGDIGEHRERSARDRALAVGLSAAEQVLDLGRGVAVHRAVAPDPDRRMHLEVLVEQLDLDRRRRALEDHHRERLPRYRRRAPGGRKTDRSRRGEFELEDHGYHGCLEHHPVRRRTSYEQKSVATQMIHLIF